MKKIISVILSLFYLTLSSGSAINMHYCGGELESIKINSHSENCCCGNKEMSNGCCQNEELNLKLDVDQQMVSANHIYLNEIAVFIVISIGVDSFIDIQIEEELLNEFNIPPPKSDPIWLLNCSLTYYG